MQRMLTSKNPYGGLERVRSAGTLVVGLDQQFPSRRLTPSPPASIMNSPNCCTGWTLSLKIYWGYSFHDSYPSRLATRKLCDVMLGVMPDDRFANRVLYFQPCT